MKRKQHVGRFLLLPLFTLMIMAGGALMPFGASLLQDAYISREGEVWMLKPVSLTLQQDVEIRPLLRLLKLLSGENFLRSDWKGETNLTPSEAVNAAQEAISLLKDEELLTGLEEYRDSLAPGTVIMSPSPLSFVTDAVYDQKEGEGPTVMVSVSPALYVSEGGEFSAVVWECSLTPYRQPEYIVRVDDSSGKMVGLTAQSFYLDFDAPDYDGALMAALQADRWSRFCQSYYEITIQDCQPVFQTGSSMAFRLRHTLESGETLELPLTIYENHTVFNR